MVSFDYTIHDAMGLHARPVGLVVKAVAPYRGTKIEIHHGDKVADAHRLFAIMSLQVKQNETISVVVDGDGEAEIAQTIRGIFESENL